MMPTSTAWWWWWQKKHKKKKARRRRSSSWTHHHDDGVEDAQQFGHHDLRARLGRQAHDDEQDDGDQVQNEAGQLVDLEGRVHRADDHQEDGARSDHRAEHHQSLPKVSLSALLFQNNDPFRD